MLIERGRSCLMVVDVQERLAPAMANSAAVIRNSAVLMQAAERLQLPLLVSEQYPQGLGPTVPELRALTPAGAVHAKLSFSCADDPGLAARLAAFERPQVAICGIEAHVCVLQTALGLQAGGYQPSVVADATSSRTTANREAGLARLRDAGVTIVTTEMVLFEWLGAAGTPEFRELSKLIR